MSNYHTRVDPSARNSSHALMLEMVGHDKDVLDVGCSSGYLAAALGAQGCHVSGIEYVAEDAEEARPHLDKLVVGDVTQLDLVELFGEASFDAVVFGDLLEHLPDPAPVLQGALPLLREGGAVVISVPNVAHGSLRLALLEGRWNYTPTGLLDRTHLHFFTRDSLAEMLAGAGLEVQEVVATVVDPLGGDVRVDEEGLPLGALAWVWDQPESLWYQFVVRAVRGAPGTPWPPVVAAAQISREGERSPALDEATDDPARQRDLLALEVRDLRRRVLTMRDRAIGATAELGQLRAAATTVESRVAAAVAAEEAARGEWAQAVAEIERMRRSASWRLGNRLVRPLARVLRTVRGTR